jgi:hypothetical protein
LASGPVRSRIDLPYQTAGISSTGAVPAFAEAERKSTVYINYNSFINYY